MVGMERIPDERSEEAAQLLVSMLSTAPALATELAELLDALDEGESVYVDGVKDASLRAQLAAFLAALGLSAPDGEQGDEGAGKAFRCGKGGGGVLRAVADLMDGSGMVGPQPLDKEAAFDTARKVVDTLAAEEGMDSVRREVPALLEQILGGELVVLEGVGDGRIRNTLFQLFKALGLQSRRAGDGEDAGYGIPDRGFDDTEAVMKRLITAYGGVSGRNSTGGEAEEGGDADKGDAAETSAAAEPRRSPIGPAMPSAAMLAQAQRAALAYSQLEASLSSSSSDDEDEDDDAVGPSVAGKEKRVASQRVDPQNAKRQKRQELKRAAEWERATGVITGGQAALEKDVEADGGAREEWMLVPPKSLGVLGAIKTLQPTNRKFQTRSARGARADLHAPKAPKSLAELEAEAAAEELMAKHREARGPSLVERHKLDKVSGGKVAKGAGRGRGAQHDGGAQKSFSWSREDDMESRRRLTPQMYEELVQKSQQLDSKFSRSVSRNFL